jgi:hypothetical protein
LLLEVDPAGRWTRLELATAAGVLTLHPEPDMRSAHGNVVTGRGVVPLAFGWSPGHRLVLADEPIAAAALGDDELAGREVPGLVVDARLEPRATGRAMPPRRPAGGLPGPSWPLEAEAEADAEADTKAGTDRVL